ncbi:MAG: anion permease, partial [Nitrospinae bacterium]|nr:anion permease [Nitrospinota bacterium]
GQVRAELDGADGVTALETAGPGQVIGEVALLTGQPRTATVRAVTPTQLWCLSRQKLDALMLKDPTFALHFNHLVGSRLANVSRHLTAAKEALAKLSQAAWASMTPTTQELLAKVAPLQALTAPIVDMLMDGHGPPLLAELQKLHAIDDAGVGRYLVEPSIRARAAAHFREQHGERGYRAWAHSLAKQCQQSGDYGNAVEAFLEAGAGAKAETILRDYQDELLTGWGSAQVAQWVERTAPQGESAVGLWRFGGRCAEMAGQDDAAIVLHGHALKAAEETDSREDIARSAAALAAVYERRGAKELARTYVQMGLAALGQDDELAHGQIGMGSLYAALSHWLHRKDVPWRVRLRPLGAVLGLVAFYTAWLASPALGMSLEANKLIAILAGAVVFWVLDVAPEFVTALTACMLALLWGAAPARVVFSGFTNSSFFLLLVIFGFSWLATRSGLTFRVALLGMKLFPATYWGQAWALAFSGLMASTVIPTTSGRLTMVGPLILAIKDTLRFPDRSRGAAGLALAGYVGYSQMSFLFLNGTGACFVMMGLLPPTVAQKINWGNWLLTALPLGLVIFVGTVLTALWRFRPETEGPMERRILQAQLATLGNIDYQEKLGLLALTLLLLIFVLKPFHRVEPAWLAMIMVIILFVLGADRNMFKSIDYQYLLYFAAFLSLANMIRSTGADATLVTIVRPHLAVLTVSPYFFLSTLCVVAYVLMAFVPWLPSQPILILSTIPLAESMGYNPFVLGLVILATLMPGIAPNLGTGHQVFSIATEQRAFTYGHIKELAVFHAAFILLGAICSIPFWRMLGMVP